MPKFHPTPIIQDCWSSIGDITFYHRNGQCYWKRKARTPFVGSPAQLDQAQVHHRAILAWQRQPHSIQLQWNECARTAPSHRPPYNEPHHISGFNLFVSAYHGFAQLGREHVPVPQPFPKFPSATLELLQIIPGTGVTALRCRLTLTDIVNPVRWHLSARVQLTASGMGSYSGYMRSCMVTHSSPINIIHDTSSLVITLNAANSIIGHIRAHIKYCLIDDITGYRNNWQRVG